MSSYIFTTDSNDALSKDPNFAYNYKNLHLLTHASLLIVHCHPHLSFIFRLREQAANSSSSLYSSQFYCELASRFRFDTIT